MATRLAVDDLPRRPGRSGSTVATIAIALGISLTLAVMVESMQAAWVAWIEQHFAADLLVGGGGRVHLLSGPPLAPEVAMRVGAVAGVAAVEPFHVLRIRVEDRPVSLEGMAIDERLRRGGLPMVEGNLEAAAPALLAGTGVLLSDNLALRLRLHRGDEITVPTPGGPRPFRIEGTFVDYLGALDLGSIAVDWEQLGRIWDDHFATTLRVWLLPGADAGQASRAVRASLGPGSGLYVLTAREFVDGIRGVLRQFFIAGWALEIVSAIIGILGVITTQLATVLDRASELRTLRTIGVPDRSITTSLALECGLLGLLGGIVAVAISAIVGAEGVLGTFRIMAGWRLRVAWPVESMVAAVVLATLVSAMAGLVPARAAARLELGVGGVE